MTKRRDAVVTLFSSLSPPPHHHAEVIRSSAKRKHPLPSLQRKRNWRLERKLFSALFPSRRNTHATSWKQTKFGVFPSDVKPSSMFRHMTSTHLPWETSDLGRTKFCIRMLPRAPELQRPFAFALSSLCQPFSCLDQGSSSFLPAARFSSISSWRLSFPRFFLYSTTAFLYLSLRIR